MKRLDNAEHRKNSREDLLPVVNKNVMISCLHVPAYKRLKRKFLMKTAVLFSLHGAMEKANNNGPSLGQTTRT